MVQFTSVAAVVACAFGLADAAAARLKCRDGFPNLPFNTDGPKIIDASGNNVKLAGTNWPGHGEVMVPEGLQYQSIETIVSDIKSLGMNVVRLTYAIEMVDQIYKNNGEDVDLQTAFTQGLGQENGTAILADVLSNNPQFTASTKRLEVCGMLPLTKQFVNHGN
jgi:hypothetical protein